MANDRLRTAILAANLTVEDLAAKVNDAWLNFARTGDPNHSGLPKWPAYTAQTGPVMVFDKTCEIQNDPDRELRKTVAEALGEISREIKRRLLPRQQRRRVR